MASTQVGPFLRVLLLHVKQCESQTISWWVSSWHWRWRWTQMWSNGTGPLRESLLFLFHSGVRSQHFIDWKKRKYLRFHLQNLWVHATGGPNKDWVKRATFSPSLHYNLGSFSDQQSVQNIFKALQDGVFVLWKSPGFLLNILFLPVLQVTQSFTWYFQQQNYDSVNYFAPSWQYG